MECLGTKSVAGFVEEIKRETGVDVRECYQCAKCTAGCPTSFAMDSPPSRIMHLVQLGLREAALKSKSIWLCVGCETCSARCPRELEPSKVMKALCAIAAREKVPIEDPDVRVFHEAFLRPVRYLGRSHEMAMMGELKLRTLNLLQDLGLGAALFQRGKLKPLPEVIKGRKAVGRMFQRASTAGGADSATHKSGEEPEH
jgi:heterodisulfide reductase subunit C